MSEKNVPLVVVTAFRKFENLTRNPSQDVLNLLTAGKANLETKLGIKLVLREVDVAYEPVDALIDEIWNELKPQVGYLIEIFEKPALSCFQFVLHLGLGGEQGQQILVETRAWNSGYQRPDVQGLLSKDVSLVSRDQLGCRLHPQKPVLFGQRPGYSGVDRWLVKLAVRNATRMPLWPFERPGQVCVFFQTCHKLVPKKSTRFLCGYIYFKSLEKDACRCVFLHLPIASCCSWDLVRQCARQIELLIGCIATRLLQPTSWFLLGFSCFIFKCIVFDYSLFMFDTRNYKYVPHDIFWQITRNLYVFLKWQWVDGIVYSFKKRH